MTGDYERYNFWYKEMDESIKEENIKYNKEVDDAVQRVLDGKSISNDGVITEIDKW